MQRGEHLGDDRGPPDLEAQLANKEREWKELQSLRVQMLETSLNMTTEQLSSLRARFHELKEDFRFNLTVLEERDRELEKYDIMAAKAQIEETARQEELSQLLNQVSKLEEQREQEVKEREEALRLGQLQAAEHRLKLEKLQSSMAGDIQKQREDYEKMKHDLQHRIQEVEGELSLQRQEMRADFDKELRLREHEFNLKMDEMRAVVLSHNLKVKLLSKELEVQVRAQLQAAESLQTCEELHQEAQRQLQHKDLEIRDVTTVRDHRIKELEAELQRTEVKLKKEEEGHFIKHQDLDRALRECQAQLAAQCQAHTEQLQKAEQHMFKLQGDMERLAAETCRAQREHQEALAQRDETIQRLHTEVEMTRSSWDKYITQASKETVAKDTELLALQASESKLRAELEKNREEVARYKKQLSAGLEREKSLEQRCVQVELDWQRRCEDTKADHYMDSEHLIQGLTQARNQAQAELKERDNQLQELTVLLRSVTSERDQALQGVRPSGAPLASEEICHLQQQNSSLRAVVAQMRKDMEDLGQLQARASPPPPDTSSTSRQPGQPPDTTLAAPGIPEYTQALMQEVSMLKAQCRQLEEQLGGATGPSSAPTAAATEAPAVSPENGYLQDHIRSLNETIGGLRVEKVANTAALKRQEVRVAHLESALSKLTQQCHAMHLEGEELRLELANQKRRWGSEEACLRQRLAMAEMELDEVRREKEEFQKGNILNHLETVALGNQVSALKLNIASRQEPIICEQSEVVRLLQEENLHLRQQHLAMGLNPGRDVGEAQGDKSSAHLSTAMLKAKLKQATRLIVCLQREKQQLIEMGNRLRAQLITVSPAVLQPSVRPANPVDPKRDPDQPRTDHLSALEQLQYQLTTQELQYAQREQRPGAPILVQTLNSEYDSRGEGTHGAANPWAQGHKGMARHEHRGSKEIALLALDQSQSSVRGDGVQRPPSSSSGPLLSSVATEGSLRDVWLMLEQGTNLSMLTEGDLEPARRDLAEPAQSLGVKVRGQGIKARVQTHSQVQGRRATGPTNSKPGGAGRTSKIRNYNIKD